MESRSPLHQPANQKSGLVPVRTSAVALRLPLLPFERELIAALGCSEDEYRFFADQAYKRAGIRPAEYAHIPEVNAELTTIIVSLVLGAVLQGVSYLLTPKPRQAQQQPGQPTTQQLASVTGLDRFSPTTGFDSFADLANYNDPVPIIFGDYTGETGGILAAPRLVWSRAYS